MHTQAKWEGSPTGKPQLPGSALNPVIGWGSWHPWFSTLSVVFLLSAKVNSFLFTQYYEFQVTLGEFKPKLCFLSEKVPTCFRSSILEDKVSLVNPLHFYRILQGSI